MPCTMCMHYYGTTVSMLLSAFAHEGTRGKTKTQQTDDATTERQGRDHEDPPA